MVEKIYTIPINEAFNRAPSGTPPDCPFCLLYDMLENKEIESILGPSMMEPDIRIETNKNGFCRHHYDMMYERGNRLGLGLILESHIAEIEKEIFKGGTLLDPSGKREEEKIEKLSGDCYVCGRIESNFFKMFGTMVFLYETEEDFREKFAFQKYYCLPHYKMMLEHGRIKLSKKQFSDYYKTAREIEKNYIKELGDDVSWFCKKFDYRYEGEPWHNSKDSIPRTIIFLSGGKNNKS